MDDFILIEYDNPDKCVVIEDKPKKKIRQYFKPELKDRGCFCVISHGVDKYNRESGNLEAEGHSVRLERVYETWQVCMDCVPIREFILDPSYGIGGNFSKNAYKKLDKEIKDSFTPLKTKKDDENEYMCTFAGYGYDDEYQDHYTSKERMWLLNQSACKDCVSTRQLLFDKSFGIEGDFFGKNFAELITNGNIADEFTDIVDCYANYQTPTRPNIPNTLYDFTRMYEGILPIC